MNKQKQRNHTGYPRGPPKVYCSDTPRLDGRGNLSEKSVEGLHNTLCGILSAAVDEGYLTHNPAWRCYKPKGQKKERPVADEETVKKLITAFEGQSMKYETYFKLVLATGL